MDARKVSVQLRAALAASGLTLWELARRAEMDLSVVAAVLGGFQNVPLESTEAVGWALDLELGFVPASREEPPAGPVMSVVDVALNRPKPAIYFASPGGSPVLALGLDGLFSSNGSSVHARPGLLEFLECCRGLFARIVAIANDEGQFRETARSLVKDGAAPVWFASVEVVSDAAELSGSTWAAEDVLQVSVGGGEAARPGQVHISHYEAPYNEQDGELGRAVEELVSQLTARAA